jgi:hypothetical protein
VTYPPTEAKVGDIGAETDDVRGKALHHLQLDGLHGGLHLDLHASGHHCSTRTTPP